MGGFLRAARSAGKWPRFLLPASVADPRIPGRASTCTFRESLGCIARMDRREKKASFLFFPHGQRRPSEPNCLPGTEACTGALFAGIFALLLTFFPLLQAQEQQPLYSARCSHFHC